MEDYQQCQHKKHEMLHGLRRFQKRDGLTTSKSPIYRHEDG